MEFAEVEEVTEVLSCPGGDGSISFDERQEIPHSLMNRLGYGHIFFYMPYPKPRERIARILWKHSSRTGRLVTGWIARASRGDEKRLKGKAKTLKWEGEVQVGNPNDGNMLLGSGREGLGA